MGDWPIAIGTSELLDQGLNTASTTLTSVTSSATPNAMGSWTQIVASSPIDAQMVHVMLSVDDSTRDSLMDLGIGAVGAEKIVFPKMLLTNSNNDRMAWSFLMPVPVKAGIRIVARVQTSSISLVRRIGLHLMGRSFLGFSAMGRVLAWGADILTSSGTLVDPGTVANTFGAWSELVSSTINKVRALYVMVGNNNLSVRGTCAAHLQIGIGAAGSEKVLIPQMQLRSQTATDLWTPRVFGPFFAQVPAGVRISAKAQCSITTATERLIPVVVYGVD